MNYPKELIEAMKMADDAHASDGAWQQLIEDSVSMYNENNGTNFDEFDAFMYYVDNVC